MKENFLSQVFTPHQHWVLSHLPNTYGHYGYRQQILQFPPHYLRELGRFGEGYFMVRPDQMKRLCAWNETLFQEWFLKLEGAIYEIYAIEQNTTSLKSELNEEAVWQSEEYVKLQKTKLKVLWDLIYTEAIMWTEVALGYLVKLSAKMHSVTTNRARGPVTSFVAGLMERLQTERVRVQNMGLYVAHAEDFYILACNSEMEVLMRLESMRDPPISMVKLPRYGMRNCLLAS